MSATLAFGLGWLGGTITMLVYVLLVGRSAPSYQDGYEDGKLMQSIASKLERR